MPTVINGWNKTVTADSVINLCIEQPGLYQLMNRSYDALIAPGATSVRRPLLADLTVRVDTGADFVDDLRPAIGAKTKTVESALHTFAVGILAEMAAKFGSNNLLVTQYENAMALALGRKFSYACIDAADKTAFITETAATGTLTWEDILRMDANMTAREVPQENRVFVIPAALSMNFWGMDVMKGIVTHQVEIFNSGKLIEFMGKYFITVGNPAKVGQNEKDAIRLIYGPGLAFGLSHFGEIEDAYSPKDIAHAYDMLAYGFAELDDYKFAEVMTIK